MDVPSIISLRQTDTEFAGEVACHYSPDGTTILMLEMNPETVSISHLVNVGQGQRLQMPREDAVEVAKLIIWQEERRIQAEQERADYLHRVQMEASNLLLEADITDFDIDLQSDEQFTLKVDGQVLWYNCEPDGLVDAVKEYLEERENPKPF